MSSLFMAGTAKQIIENHAEKIVDIICSKLKGEWEKFKIDFDFAFVKYVERVYGKYSKIKTILYRTEPQYIYDFYEVPFLKKKGKNEKIFLADSVERVLDLSHFIIIQGTGGIGKTMLMKHLFLDELAQKDLIPIFLELKDINNRENDFDIMDYLFDKLSGLGSTIKIDYLEYALKSGSFLFILDGYDEILTEKRYLFFEKMDRLCDSYPDNYYVVSTRPYSDFIEMQRFTVLDTCPLNKKQALSLIGKISYDEELKKRFMIALERKLFDQHKSFASNPLLLNIMLLTYDNYADFPEKVHLFYGQAFETMFSKHDATKAGFKRERCSGLTFDQFKKVLSWLCFLSYSQEKLEFNKDDLKDILSKYPFNDINIVDKEDEYIDDLTNFVCVLCKDGFYYQFVHRSFQEYFTALFLKELPDENMKKISINLIKKEQLRASCDNVFVMLQDMTEEKFETNIILPLLEEFEMNIEDEDIYDYYTKSIVQWIEYGSYNTLQYDAWLSYEINDGMRFIYEAAKRKIVRITGMKETVYDEDLFQSLMYGGYAHYYSNEPGSPFTESVAVTGKELIEVPELKDIVRNLSLGKVIGFIANWKKDILQNNDAFDKRLTNAIKELQ